MIHKETSIEAFYSMFGHRNRMCWEVYRLLAQWSTSGLTRRDLETMLGWRWSTTTARVWELLKADLIVEGPDKRLTPSGRKAFVLRVKAA